MRRSIYIGLLAAMVLFVAGCGKKWKKTSDAFFDVEVSKPSVDDPFIQITGGTLYVSRFSFEGARKQGEDVTFEDDFEGNSASININTSTMVPVLNYDIPQGTYSEIKVKFEFENTNSNLPMTIEGVYKDMNNEYHSFTVEIDDKLESEITAINKNGGNEIVIIAEDQTIASITFDMKQWFALVPENLIQDAFLASPDKNTIIISSDENEEIYALIANRIGIGDHMTFQ